MFDLTYLALRKRLLTDIPTLEVDWYTGQDDLALIETPMFKLPAAYIEFQPFATQTQGRGKLQGTLRINIHVITQEFTTEQTRFQQAALQHFKLVNQVHNSLSNFNAKAIYIYPEVAEADNEQLFNSLSRTSISPDHRPGPFRKSTLVYQCLATDLSGTEVYEKITATPLVDMSFL